jgi:hypothetical protein
VRGGQERSIDTRTALDRITRSLPRCQRLVPAAVTSVLRDAADPMRIWDIHAAVERLVGEPLS